MQRSSLLAVGIEEFKQQVKEGVFYEPPPLVQRPINAFVFVATEAHDRKLANSICEELKRYGAGYMLPRREGKPVEMRKDLKEKLSTCNALIVVYAKSTHTWVEEQLMQTKKILAGKPPPALAVYNGPPGPKELLDLALPNMHTLDCLKGLNKRELRAFLDTV